MLLHKGWRAYNVTTNDGYTVEDLIKKCETLTGRKVRTTESFRPGMDLRYSLDNTRIREEFDWKPLYTFEEGVREYLNLPNENN
jgi:dTDP-glucose 4,6-dehydratase